jgi:succinoglycan biosynthesis protein ExoA
MTERSWPPVSIVIPVRNEAGTIERSLRSALDQTYAGDLQIVVADGDSDDETADIVRGIADEDDRVEMVSNPDRLTAPGLNHGIRASRGAVIVRCDAHAELPPGYVQQAVTTLLETGAANVGGVQAAEGDTFFSRAVALAMTSRLGVGDARFHLGGAAGPVDTVYLGVFDRNAIESVGLFDESLVRNQDYELNYRLRQTGHTIWFDPELQVRYRPRGSLAALWRQYFDYGRWKRAMLRANPSAVRWRQLVPPLFVLGLVVSIVLLVAGQTTAGLVVPILYGAALITGTLWAIVCRRSVAGILLPIVLPAMHIGWGVGYLIGPPED